MIDAGEETEVHARMGQKQENDGHYAIMSRMTPARHNVRMMSFDASKYSDTETESDCESDEDDDTRRRKMKADKKMTKLMRKYEHYKEFNVSEILKCVVKAARARGRRKKVMEGAEKNAREAEASRKYVLAHSENWRAMWGASLSVLGGKKYDELINGNQQRHQSLEGGNILPPIGPSHQLTNNPLVNQRGQDNKKRGVNEKIQNSLSGENSIVALEHSLDENDRILEERERAFKREQQLEREEFMKKIHCSVASTGILSQTKYGATSKDTNEVTATLRKIGKAMEHLSKEERSDLVGRGNIDLVERTILRTRLQMFLGVCITSREVDCLFKKFDHDKMGTVNMADVYGNAMNITRRKKNKYLEKDRTRKRSNSNGMTVKNHVEMKQSNRPKSRDVFVSTELDEKITPLGELDGTIRCTVQLTQQEDKNSKIDREIVDEVDEDDDIRNESMTPCSTRKTLDFNRTVRTDIHDEDMLNEFDKLDEFLDPPTPDHGMGLTQNVRDFNTLAESDSVNNIFLNSIEEDIQEEETEELLESVEDCCLTSPTKSPHSNGDKNGNTAGEKDYWEDSFESTASGNKKVV